MFSSSISQGFILNLRKKALHALLCVFSLSCMFFLTACGETVDEYSQRLQYKLNNDLSNSNHSFRRYVEDVHVTVDAKSAYVSNLRVITKDGSQDAGDNGSNVREIQADIVIRWDGIFHKDGETVLSIVWDASSGSPQVSSAKITKTDAVVDVTDPGFWFAAAACLILTL